MTVLCPILIVIPSEQLATLDEWADEVPIPAVLAERWPPDALARGVIVRALLAALAAGELDLVRIPSTPEGAA